MEQVDGTNPQANDGSAKVPPSLPREKTQHSASSTHYSLSHDLNNLFTGLIGNLSLLKEHPSLPPEIKQRLALLEKSAQKAFELTQQLTNHLK